VADALTAGQTRGRVFAHALGNVFLGIAIGLVAYYFATDLLNGAEQRVLAREFPRAAETANEPTTSRPALDFDGWASEDRAYGRKLKPGQPFGRPESPRMGLDAVVVKGTARSDLMKGPGWIEWTDLPGPTGNAGIAGHRTTYGAPFRNIDKLQRGDTIRFTSPYRVYIYRVRRVFSVTPDKVEVMAHSEEPLLTMSACHPPYSARLRFIAQSELVSVQKIDR